MVIHIITSLNIGGAEMMLKKVVAERLRIGVKDVVICLISDGKVGEQIQKLGVDVHYLRICSIFSLFKGLFRLDRLLKEYPENAVVQTWLYHSDLIGGIVAKLNNRKVVWNIRQTKFTSSKSFFTVVVMRVCALLSYFIPDKIISVANSSMSSHVKYGYNKKKFLVISNGFEERDEITQEEKMLLLKELDLTNGDALVGVVGRFHPDKDYLNFIKAAELVKGEYPSVKFIMIGHKMDSSNMELVNWIESRKLQGNFILVGESNKVANYLSILSVFCLSSISEGFPNVVGEAMYNKIPCVVTDSGDSAIIVGETGIVVQPKDPKVLAEGLIEILNLTNEERMQKGIAARKRIEENYMITRIVEQYSNLYNQLSKC